MWMRSGVPRCVVGADPMARVLLGWELGANRGHIVRLAEIARALIARGHDVHAALQTVDGVAEAFPEGVTIWQGPVWPRLIVNAARTSGPPVATMGDILARLGLDSADAFAGLIRAWDSILGAVQPDVVLADFAPALLRAAHRRVPTLAIGTGFERAPDKLAQFPSLSGAAPVYAETELLGQVNNALARTGRTAIAALPALFAADRALVASFSEIDCYVDAREDIRVSPSIGAPPPPISEGRGDEVFVYGFEAIMADAALWDGLAKSKLPVRVHVPKATHELRNRLVALGLAFEPDPVPLDDIMARSRLIVSHGGLGIVSAALLGGVPQVITHYDLEKRVTADCVTRLGLGGQVPLRAIRAEPFAESLKRLYDDTVLGERARAAAPGFHAQMDRPLASEAADAVAALTG